MTINCWCVGYAVDIAKRGASPESAIKDAAVIRRFIKNEPDCKIESIKSVDDGKN